MTAFPLPAASLALVGASTLLGREVKSLLEASRLAACDLTLLDDEAAGTLTEAAGEPALILKLDAGSFEHKDLVFFAGSAAFARRHAAAARRAGAQVVDLSGALLDMPGVLPWIPLLDALLPPPEPPGGASPEGRMFFSPPAATIIACTLAAALRPLAPEHVALMLLQPVSECGQAGIEELESQTVKLLSFQPFQRSVFDAQVAFNIVSRYGPASPHSLSASREAISRAAASYLAGRCRLPAIQLLQVPVFYSYAFAACAQLSGNAGEKELEAALAAAGVSVEKEGEAPPDNVSVAGESQIRVTHVVRDAAQPGAWWIGGAADNMRLSALNALHIAERLLAS